MKPTRTSRPAMAGLIVLVGLGLLASCAQQEQPAPAISSGGAPSEQTVSAMSAAPEGTGELPAQLIVQHRDAGAWTDITNAFAVGECDPTKPNRRSGLLFQFGTLKGAMYRYKEIQIHGAKPDTFANVVWVNMIAEHSIEGKPIEPAKALGLYPNKSNQPDPNCPECANQPEECRRTRLLNPYLSFGALLTFWQGPSGWSATAKEEKNPCTGNSFRFSFTDPFRVEVYSLTADANGNPVIGVPREYAVGEVDSVVVVVEENPAGDLGKIQDPPWLYP